MAALSAGHIGLGVALEKSRGPAEAPAAGGDQASVLTRAAEGCWVVSPPWAEFPPHEISCLGQGSC